MPKGGYAPVFKPFKSAAPQRAVTPTMVSRNTILVLPFSDHSPGGDQKYFCHGVSEEIIHTLARNEATRYATAIGCNALLSSTSSGPLAEMEARSPPSHCSLMRSGTRSGSGK